MKNIKKISILVILFIIFIYVTAITSIPNQIILFQEEAFNFNHIFGIYLKTNTGEAISASSDIGTKLSGEVGKRDLKLDLLGFIPVKDITVNVIPKEEVIPIGDIVGLKLYVSRSTRSRNV